MLTTMSASSAAPLRLSLSSGNTYTHNFMLFVMDSDSTFLSSAHI